MADFQGVQGGNGSSTFVDGLVFPPFSVREDITKRQLAYLHGLLKNAIPVMEPVYFPTQPCFQWVKALDKDGYARHRPPRYMPGSTLVHRFMFQHVTGGDLEGITVDHACGNRACINMAHLRLLDRSTNLKLGDHRRIYSR
jgi:hypothetical protein